MGWLKKQPEGPKGVTLVGRWGQQPSRVFCASFNLQNNTQTHNISGRILLMYYFTRDFWYKKSKHFLLPGDVSNVKCETLLCSRNSALYLTKVVFFIGGLMLQ